MHEVALIRCAQGLCQGLTRPGKYRIRAKIGEWPILVQDYPGQLAAENTDTSTVSMNWNAPCNNYFVRSGSLASALRMDQPLPGIFD